MSRHIKYKMKHIFIDKMNQKRLYHPPIEAVDVLVEAEYFEDPFGIPDTSQTGEKEILEYLHGISPDDDFYYAFGWNRIEYSDRKNEIVFFSNSCGRELPYQSSSEREKWRGYSTPYVYLKITSSQDFVDMVEQGKVGRSNNIYSNLRTVLREIWDATGGAFHGENLVHIMLERSYE